ncbi:hypothetical protein [Rhizobium sp. ICMP 5592]|uniref:hypothetical protein n=1 Tax=Rhizobium sp. ICMP 5592 TaxID=2292445 RepID=UPI001294E2D3|nr:hypothetical protein [Rhizobium sp. ICMP 5592]MQB43047.1 hypothetical protein [Rhizobium sp. ICMP 5592]
MADCTYSVPDLVASGDQLYGPRICNQEFIDWAWHTHGFNGDYWQDGWGYDDVCNIRKPLARCLSAIWLLNYSAEDYNNEDWNTDALHWGPRYVREQFKHYDDLRASCGDGDAKARTSGCQQSRQWNEWRCTSGYDETQRECRSWFFLFAWICHLWAEVKRFVCTIWGWVSVAACTIWYGTFGGGQNVTLFLSFFYPLDGTGNADVISRAGTLIHEARHIGNRPHNAQFPAGSIFGAGKDGADSTWGYEGAWMYNTLYLWWFYAAGTRTNIAMRQAAKQRANLLLTNAFATSPGLTVS